MSAEFVDTNILVYAYDTSAGDKHTIARDLLVRLWETESGVLSTQVLQEFYVTVTRKIARPLSNTVARERVIRLGTWRVVTPSTRSVVRAIDLSQACRISFWDALILESARDGNATTVWSENLNTGQDYEGVGVQSPFGAGQ